MLCRECIKSHEISGGLIRMVPRFGRAAENQLCCKHDRIKFGPQKEGEKGEKQINIEKRKAEYRHSVVL